MIWSLTGSTWAIVEHSALVVVEDCGEYVLLCTAYAVDRQHQRGNLSRGHETHLRAEAAR